MVGRRACIRTISTRVSRHMSRRSTRASHFDWSIVCDASTANTAGCSISAHRATIRCGSSPATSAAASTSPTGSRRSTRSEKRARRSVACPGSPRSASLRRRSQVPRAYSALPRRRYRERHEVRCRPPCRHGHQYPRSRLGGNRPARPRRHHQLAASSHFRARHPQGPPILALHPMCRHALPRHHLRATPHLLVRSHRCAIWGTGAACQGRVRSICRHCHRRHHRLRR